MMKVFLMKLCLLGTAVVAAIFVVGNWDNDIYKKKNIEPNILRLEALQQMDSLDILFIGSSHVYSGILPTVFDSAGLKTYNVGLSAAGVKFAEIVIENYFGKTRKKPKNVVVEINAAEFCSATDNFNLFSIHRYLNPPLSDEYLFSHGKIGVRDYVQLRYHSFEVGLGQMLNRKNMVEINEQIKREAQVRGFWTKEQRADGDIQNDSVNAVDGASHTGLKLEEYSDARELEVLEFLGRLKRQGVNVIVVEMPNNVYDHFFSVPYIKRFDAFWTKVDSLGIKRVVKPAGYSFECYRDPHHLSVTGAQKYTTYLLRYLKDNRLLAQ